MSFGQKLTENKSMLLAAVGGIASAYILYKLIKGGSKVETASQKRRKQIEALKKQINVNNPTLQDIKKVMTYALNEAKHKVDDFAKLFKQKRLKYTKVTRKQHIKQYLMLLQQGMQTMQLIAIQEQQQLLAQIGLKQYYLQKYRSQLAGPFQQIMAAQTQDVSHIKPMKLQDVKFAIRRQIQFIKQQGVEYADLIINSTKDWPHEKRTVLPMLLSLLVADCAFQGYPQIDEQSVQYAQTQYQKQLMGEIQQLQIAMTPMMLRLNSTMKQVSAYDLSDIRLDNSAGFSPQQIDELKILQHLQNQAIHNLGRMAESLSHS